MSPGKKVRGQSVRKWFGNDKNEEKKSDANKFDGGKNAPL